MARKELAKTYIEYAVDSTQARLGLSDKQSRDLRGAVARLQARLDAKGNEDLALALLTIECATRNVTASREG